MNATGKFSIPSITNQGNDVSVFSSREVQLSGESVRMLSDQQECVNFRLRYSDPSFSSDFHVAGDPTLLVVLEGTVRISLQNGEYKDFSAGNMFVAEDYLNADTEFDSAIHGHSAKVIGDASLRVLHLKLEKR